MVHQPKHSDLPLKETSDYTMFSLIQFNGFQEVNKKKANRRTSTNTKGPANAQTSLDLLGYSNAHNKLVTNFLVYFTIKTKYPLYTESTIDVWIVD